MTTESTSRIGKLLKGIATDDIETVRDAWRAMLAQGDNAISTVLEKLHSPTWEVAPKGSSAEYLAVLLSLLDELDKNAFALEIKRLQSLKLHPLHRKTVDVIGRRVSEDPVTEIGNGIPVFVSEEFKDKSVILNNLGKWSQTEGLSLSGISRIDVIVRAPSLDYLGLYSLLFSGVILSWPEPTPRGMRLFIERLRAEFTFYHEVGHHVHGHLEGGSVEKQEREADDYARQMMRSSKPFLTRVARILVWPLRLYRKLQPE